MSTIRTLNGEAAEGLTTMTKAEQERRFRELSAYSARGLMELGPAIGDPCRVQLGALSCPACLEAREGT